MKARVVISRISFPASSISRKATEKETMVPYLPCSPSSGCWSTVERERPSVSAWEGTAASVSAVSALQEGMFSSLPYWECYAGDVFGFNWPHCLVISVYCNCSLYWHSQQGLPGMGLDFPSCDVEQQKGMLFLPLPFHVCTWKGRKVQKQSTYHHV